MVYWKMYRIVAWVFLGVGALLAIACACVMIFNGVSGSDLFAFETDAAIGAFVCAVMAAAFLLLAAVFGGVCAMYSRRAERLRAEGMKIEAVIDDIQPLYNYADMTTNPYVVVCRWEYDNKVYIYRSEYMRFNPTKYFEDHGIKTMTVYVDKYNPRRYYIDISELTKNVVLA
ncbi:MAG: hypothetical protein LBH66_07335 [Oscillospiraceae bacterium]|jgi:hypothetical protein|nr:hypothetical protein [Oscillospiraceae bacterium]